MKRSATGPQRCPWPKPQPCGSAAYITFFSFHPLRSFQLGLDGEVVGFLENSLDENGNLQLELSAELEEATRGHLMSSAMGFMIMSDFLDQLN